MISRRLLLITTGFLGIVNSALSQTIEESWLTQAGITCGGGMSVGRNIEGDINLIKKLRLVTGGVSGSYEAAELEALLKQFKESEKSAVYQNYIQCLLNVMQMATTASGLPPKEVVLVSPKSVADLDVIPRGSRVALAPGDSISVGNLSQVFSLTKIDANNGSPTIHYSWSNSETGTSDMHKYAYQAQPIIIAEACVIVPYKIDAEKTFVSIIVNC